MRENFKQAPGAVFEPRLAADLPDLQDSCRIVVFSDLLSLNSVLLLCTLLPGMSMCQFIFTITLQLHDPGLM